MVVFFPPLWRSVLKRHDLHQFLKPFLPRRPLLSRQQETFEINLILHTENIHMKILLCETRIKFAIVFHFKIPCNRWNSPWWGYWFTKISRTCWAKCPSQLPEMLIAYSLSWYSTILLSKCVCICVCVCVSLFIYTKMQLIWLRNWIFSILLIAHINSHMWLVDDTLDGSFRKMDV